MSKFPIQSGVMEFVIVGSIVIVIIIFIRFVIKRVFD